MDLAFSRRIYRAALRIFRRNRAIGRLHGTALTLTESQILTELQSDAAVDSARLAHLMLLDQSSISRNLAKLERAGFIKSQPLQSDRRAKSLLITRSGKTVIAAIDRAANRLLEEFSYCLSKSEQHDFFRLFTRFAEGFHGDSSPRRENEHPLRYPQRRIARSLRLTERGGKSSVQSFRMNMALFVLAERYSPFTQAQVSHELNIHKSATSLILSELKDKSLVQTSENLKDGRGELIRLTPKGISQLIEYENQVLPEVQGALEKFQKSDISRFVGLIERFSGLIGNSSFFKEFQIKSCENENVRGQAREFYLNKMAQLGELGAVPGRIFDSSTSGYLLSCNGNICATLQIRLNDEARLIDAFASNIDDNPGAELIFIRAVLAKCVVKSELLSAFFAL